jgi:hypothetical protein
LAVVYAMLRLQYASCLSCRFCHLRDAQTCARQRIRFDHTVGTVKAASLSLKLEVPATAQTCEISLLDYGSQGAFSCKERS